jgi:hypothetical protein
MPFAYDDDVVQTFSANTSDNAFRVTVLPRTPGRYWYLADAQSVHTRREIMSIDPITISHQIPGCGLLRERFHNLMRRPIGCGMFGHVEMQNAPPVALIVGGRFSKRP